MSKSFYTEEHQMFRESVRKFCQEEIAPYHHEWEKAGQVPKELWLKAGENGFLCFDVPEEYGGLGLKDFRYNMILNEELVKVHATGPGFALQNDIVVPYFLNYATEEQKKKYLPQMVSGELIVAIAMTEPNTGSDLQGIETTAVRVGDSYIINGQKTFITNGILSDLVITVCKTDPNAGAAGTSLILIEKDREGFAPPRKLDKMGLHAQDTAELFFKDIEVPVSNRLGDEGHGFFYLMNQLPQERASIGVFAVAACESALEATIKYCQERHAFGKPIGKFQVNRFKLAEMKTETEIARVFLNDCIEKLNEGDLSTERAAMLKWWTTELQKRLIDQCVQLHGGYGYMMEYPIAKAYVDSRAQTIYAGTTEIMKEIIGKAMGF
jgi:alkylation response protein AidB-like acyl-CoA dehydrogenase